MILPNALISKTKPDMPNIWLSKNILGWLMKYHEVLNDTTLLKKYVPLPNVLTVL